MQATLSIDQVPPDAILACAVEDDRGQVLVAAGVHLGAAVVDGLQRRGVRSVTVCLPAEAPAPEASREEAQIRLRHLFRFSLAAGQVHPLMHIMQRFRSEQAQ